MKCFWKLTCLSALFAFAITAVARAEDGLSQPTGAVNVNFSSNLIQDEPDPAQDAPSIEQEMEEAMAVEESAAEEEECEEECPVRLIHTCCGIEIGGWISAGVYQNGDGRSSGTGNLPVLFPQVSDGATLDQAWIYAEKALPDDCCCHGWGFRIDYVFGADGPDTQAFGDIRWDNNWDSGRDYGSAIPQLYVEYGNSDMSIKAGHFYTIIGYEVVTAPDNFFYSHTYTMLYAEPFTHTGVLATKSLGCNMSVSGGWVEGWDGGFNNADDSSMFLGSVSWTSCDECLNVTYAVTAGDFGDGSISNEGDLYMHSVVASYQINECMEYVFHHDYYTNDTNTPAGTHKAMSVANYLFYTLSDCHKLGLRFEWFEDEDGVRVAQPDGNPGAYAGGDFYALTAGLNYTPNCNLIVRPEVRYDWFRGDGRPFVDGGARDQFFYGMDVILLY